MGLSQSTDSSDSDDCSSEMESDIQESSSEDGFSIQSRIDRQLPDEQSEEDVFSIWPRIVDGELPDEIITDAAVNAIDIITVKQFTLSDMNVIEADLELYEKISLIFLLEEQSFVALQNCRALLQHPSSQFLYSWAQKYQHNSNWHSKLVESLCVIQNYQILKTFGYDKNELMQDFLPRYAFSNKYLNKIRKILYKICEDLNETKTQKFLSLVRDDFIAHEVEFVNFPVQYLEMYFLYWETIGYIQPNNLTNLYKIFKRMGEEEIYERLQPYVKERKFSCNKTGDFIGIENNHSNHGQSSMSSIESNHTKQPQTIGSCYEIDPNNPGFCLIINQENFYREFDEQYKDLLPDTAIRLENRDGTKEDVDALKSTFESFGFCVRIENDLTHTKMIDEIKKTVETFNNQSSLFVCILSHGDQGTVYGVNSCRVDVSYLQRILCNSKKLLGKPKVLILQSCQGNRLQEGIYEEDEVTTDGPSRTYRGPPTTDLFTFWATVPGYAAIRNRRTGTWFIQALCNALKQFGNESHFEDICTEIVRSVSDKKWEKPTTSNCNNNETLNITMVPMKTSTFTKRFFLPPMKKF